ncbi:hypothetical protein PIB30_092429 [Stylosanthes scabra]|uniref:Uncharacterized protein n=1 Tax=Stylosanthes scabra TaxID=79078 RepID=A0ABU6YUF3_9FABA|nr:hypothetical protein [Stylosanthes scabra]
MAPVLPIQMGAINADRRLAMLERLYTRRECPEKTVKILDGVIPLPDRTSLQNRHTSRHGELNPKNPPRKKAITRLGGSSEHLDGYSSICPNQRYYEIADDMVIQLTVIVGNLCCQTSVRSIVHPHFPNPLPPPECQPNESITPLREFLAPSERGRQPPCSQMSVRPQIRLVIRPLRALRAATWFALRPPQTRKCIQVQVRKVSRVLLRP